MKIIKLILFFSFFTLTTFGQKITVSGIVQDSFNNSNQIRIVLNDTLNKFINSEENRNNYGELLRNKNFIVEPDNDGNFEIIAELNDSIFFTSYRHFTQSFLVADLVKEKNIKIKLKKEPCIEYVECNQKEKILYVFIGKKIKLDPAENIIYCDRISMDSKFKAKYQILKNIFGDFPSDTINFDIYDHYGDPGFIDLETVILYVFKNCKELIQVKYLYNNVYLDNNKWIVPYPYHLIKDSKLLNDFEIDKIRFRKTVEFDFSQRSIDWIEENFPSPFYKRKGKKVKVIFGISTDQMFEIMKKTSLKGRGYFD